MKIALFGLEEWQKEVFRNAFSSHRLLFGSAVIPASASQFSSADVMVVFVRSLVTQEVLKQFPRLRLVCTMSTGFDHIDLKGCRKKGIVVCNVPRYGENTVAEHAFGLMLGLSRRLVECVERTKKGHFSVTGLRGFDLKGKILGVIGTGNIGRHVIRIAKGFEMNVVAFDVYPNKTMARSLGFRYLSLEQLLKCSDIVTLHVPYNKHTHHLLNGKRLGMMKRGAYLINTSRGGIVDTTALVKVLQEGRLAGAGLDVLEEEGALREELELLHRHHHAGKQGTVLQSDHALLKMKNVIITPHNAFNTQEALLRIVQTTIENINGFQKGKLVNVVRI